MNKFSFTAPCLFGIESVLSGELRRMGAENVNAQNGKVSFTGDENILARANIGSRYAERILLNVGEFHSESFTELFDNVAALPWEEFIRKDDAFPVKGWCIDSALHSVPDCQSIIKKAIVSRLSKKYGIEWFEETGSIVAVRFSIHKNNAVISIDTSGEGLHKRGYRRKSNAAPLKETLAAGMCDLARIFPDTVLYDPFCGSGTILIEAALKAANIAPGLRRAFAAERYGFISQNAWQQERARAMDEVRHDITFKAYGSDIDPDAVELTLANAKKAGVEKYISAELKPLSDFNCPEQRAIVITNPPYGERLLDIAAAEELYREMGQLFKKENGKKYFIISPHDDFEKLFGRPADKRRKLYNGMLKCQMFMYFSK